MRFVVFHGVEIPEGLLAQEAQNHPGLSAAEARTAAGHALATKALLLRRASELGLAPAPELDDEGREETAEAALIRAVLEAEVEAAAPTEAECRRVYETQRARFRSSPLYEASHILIQPGSSADSDVEIARQTAARLADALARRTGAFSELARDHSDCPSGATGGSLGQLRPGDLVAEVEAALMRLEPGQIAAEPIRSRFGWHILKLDRRIEGRDLPFEVAAGAIRLSLERRAWDVAAFRYVVALAGAAREQGLALTLAEDGAVSAGRACLGDFLGDSMTPHQLAAWVDAADPALATRLREAALADGLEPSAFVRAAAAEFVGHADDERWTQLISAMRDADDPTLAALAVILTPKLAPPHPPQRTFTIIRRRARGGAPLSS